MMKFLLPFLFLSSTVYGQSFSKLKIGNSTPIDASALLEIQGTTGALLTPRMTTTQKNAISSPANGDFVYDTTLNAFSGYQNGSWQPLAGATIWGNITGTLSNQTDLQNALNLKAPLASPTFTGTVTAPTFSGSLSGNASTATALQSAPTGCSANQYADSIASNGNLTCAQVNYTQLAGVLPNPGASTLGGIESYGAVSHQWINAISTLGVPSSTQPAFSDISGTCTVAQGCVAITSAALGDTIYSSSANVWSNLTGNITSTKKFLSQTGTGSVSAAPAWAQPAFSDITGTAALTSQVTGILPVANGGTGQSALTAHDIFVGNGTSAVTLVAPSATTGVAVISNGSSSDPSFGAVNIASGSAVTGTLAVGNGGTGQASFTDGQLLIGNTTGNTLAAATLSAGSNITITNGHGTISIAASSSAAPAFSYVSQNSTLNPAVISSYYTLSGASFTVTLPDATAAGAAGKMIVLEHNGTSLTQVYTLNTTSAQTINAPGGTVASGSYKLQTQGEILWLLDDGANWQVAAHVTDGPWTSCTFLVIGSTTNPTLATTNTKTCFYKRHSNVMKVYETYTHSSATGAAIGSGTYEFTLPGAQTADTTAVVASSTLNLANSLPSSTSSLNCGGTTLWSGLATFLFDSTHLAFQEANNTGSLFASTTCGWTNTTLQMTIQAEVPISGWQP